MSKICFALNILVIISCLHLEASSWQVSMFYCGFGGQFCGQSKTDDVNQNVDIVILAFANTQKDGSVLMDQVGYPRQLIPGWLSQNKKIILSVGGESGNWADVFASDNSINNFIKSLTSYVDRFGFDGVDLDIQSYNAAPQTVAKLIINLKKSIGSRLLIVSPECVTVYQGSTVPSPDVGGQPFNYFVPIIRLADDYIDLYQPQAYNNWYDGFAGGSLQYLKDVYLNWRNLQGLKATSPIPNFKGVKGQKLLIGIPASTSAAGSSYYPKPQVVKQFKAFLTQKEYPLKGFMLWDSHWDSKNKNQASNVCKE